jgi:hypothetical protein
MRWLLRMLVTTNRPISVTAIIASLAGLVALIILVTGLPEMASTSPGGFWDRKLLAQGLGILILAFVGMRSLARGILDTFYNEQRITAGIGVHDSRYSYSKVIDSKCREIIITGHNLFAVLEAGLDTRLQDALRTNKHLKVKITCATYDAIRAVNERGAKDLIESIRKFELLNRSLTTDEQRNRLRIYFHPAAVSLSCMIRDPDDKWRALVVFTPRWGTDTVAERRVFCASEKREHRDLFEAIYQGTRYQMSELQPLADAVKDLQARSLYQPIESSSS